MSTTNLVGEAFALAADVHRSQVDKAGVPYMHHPVAVMQRATDYYLANSDGWRLEAVQATALLHDALEDIEGGTTWDRHRLSCRIYELDNLVGSAVDSLTKHPKMGHYVESYDEYLGRVERDWVARIVKIADLSHNMDAFRIPSGKITEKDFERWDKYHRAFTRLVKFEVNNA